MFNKITCIAIISSFITKTFTQTCLQDINTTHCLMCGFGYSVGSSELIVTKSSCVAKLAIDYTKTILIVIPGDLNTYANISFTQKLDNFTSSILVEEIEVRKYINPKLTYIFTVGNHLITANKPLVLFAGIPDLTFSIISMPCFGLTTCDPTWYPTLTLNTANFHFFSSKQLSFQYLQIKGSDSTACTGIGCQSTILAENLFSDTKILFESVIFTAFELEQQLENVNSIISIGRAASNITVTNVKIENCKFDSFAYQYQSSSKNLLSEYLTLYYAVSTIFLSNAPNSTLFFGNSLNVTNHNRNIGSTSNLIKVTRSFLTQSSGFFYFKENVQSFNLSNLNLTNCFSLSSLHFSIYIENSLRTDVLASNILALNQIGLLYCMKCTTLNIDTIFIENTKLNNFAIILNSTIEIKITKITMKNVEDTGTTIQIKDSIKATITSVSLTSTINPQIDITGANTEIIITDFNSSLLQYSKAVPTFNLYNCNLILKDIQFTNTDSTLTNSKMIFISNPNKLKVQNIHIENTNYYEAFNIISPGLAVLLESLSIINITSMLDASYIIAYSSTILDFTLTNSLITNHSKIAFYSSNNFASKNISLENVTISNSNITYRPALLMWHLSATTIMKNCTFLNILGKDENKNLDEIFYFGFSSIEIFNTTFKDLGFFSWRDYYLYGGTDFSFFSFYADTTIRFIGCLFSVDDTKLNHHFISTILASNLIEISESKFISTKKVTATPEYRSAYGLNLNTPTLIKITNNTFENLFCYKFPGWNSQYITSYAPICVFYSSNTETIVKDKTAIFSFNNFTNLECNNYGGTLSVLNYENVTISNNHFLNSVAPKGAFLYTKSIQNLVLTGNSFEDGVSDDSFVSINSVVNAEVSKNQFIDSNSKINSQNSILTLGVTNLLIKDSNFFQSRFSSQSKSSIIIDSSIFVSLINLKVNGSSANLFQATAMYIVRCKKVELNNSLITFTENAKFYSVHFDNNLNVVLFNTTFENNYRRIIGFSDFNTIYVDSLIITKNFESSTGESVLSFDSQTIGRVDLKNIQVFSNSYSKISLIDMLTNSEFVVDNLTLNNFKGLLLYAYLYFTVPVSIINSKFKNVEFPNSMIFGVYLNLVLSNIEIEQMIFTSSAVVLSSSTFDYNNISLTNVNGTEQSLTECFFDIIESTGKFNIKLLDTIRFGNLICLKQVSTCTIENLNIIDQPDKNKYKFLLSDKSTLIVKNSNFYNFNETIFNLASSSIIFDTAGFDSQTLTISPVANLKDSQQVIISSSTFKVRNLFIFYLYSTDYFKIENSNFIGTSSSFSILEIQYCNSFNIFSTSISNYKFTAPQNYSIKALIYTSDISNSLIDSLNVTGNQINAVPIILQKNSKNITFNKVSFDSNILIRTNGSQGVSCIKVECNDAICLTHIIANSSFFNNSAVASFPAFISDHQMKTDSVTYKENIGCSPDFPLLKLIPENIEFNLYQESVIASGLKNNIEIWIVDKDLNENVTFDSYSSATIQNYDGSVSIKENNFVGTAEKGKLAFQGLTLKALPKTYVKLKLLVTIKSIKFYDPQSVNFLNLEKVFIFYVRECIFGEVYRADDTSCSYCPIGTYSIYNSDGMLPEFCQVCPETAVCKENSTIIQKNGYWKANGNSTLILECPYPDSCFRNNGSDCLYGYEGPLCQYCSENFGKSLSSNKCIDCKANEDINMGLTFLYFIIFSIYAIVTTSLSIQRDENELDFIFSLLNIVVCHYQYLAIISQGFEKLNDVQEVTFSVSNNIDVLWGIINPNLCFLSFMYDYEERFQVVLMMIIAYVTFMVLLGIAITMFFFFRFTFNHSKKIILFKGSKKRFIITISLFIFNFFYPSLLSVNISKLPCILIDNYKELSVVKNIPRMECFGNFHIFILITMSIPGIFIFGFFIPLCLYFLLLKQRDYELSKMTSLKMKTSNQSFKMKILSNSEGENKTINTNQDIPSTTAQNLIEKEPTESIIFENHFKLSDFVNFIVKNRIFKFYTKGYKREFCHWEVGKLFLKFLLSILSNLGTFISITYIRLLIFFIFYIYAIILIKKKPFRHHFCNKLELFSLSLCVSYLIFTINNLKGNELSIFKICQVIGNSFFLLAFVISLVILGAKIAKDSYSTFYETISKTFTKNKSKKISSRESLKVEARFK